MRLEIAEIRAEFVERARAAGLDDQGQEVQRLVAVGGEPCRDVFRRARPGEQLILASYCPFTRTGPYREYGPVFLLADKTEERIDLTTLPVSAAAGSVPYLREQFVLRAYNELEEIAAARLASPETAELVISEMFSGDQVSFIHARFPTYGCYALRINRR